MGFIAEEAVDSGEAIVPDTPSDVFHPTVLEDAREDEAVVPSGVEIRCIMLGKQPGKGVGYRHRVMKVAHPRCLLAGGHPLLAASDTPIRAELGRHRWTDQSTPACSVSEVPPHVAVSEQRPTRARWQGSHRVKLAPVAVLVNE